MTDIRQPVQPSINTAFEAAPPSRPVQPDAGKQKFLAVSLLYTEPPRKAAVPPGLLSVREAARRLGVSVGAVYAACRKGRLPFVWALNTIRIDERDLEEYVEAQRRR